MKAIVYDRFGPPDVLRYEEVEKPVPKDEEVLIRVRAASLNPLDWRLMRGGPPIVRMIFGDPRGRRPGRDVAGQVESVGRKATLFKPGDTVFGAGEGSCAEYVCAPESKLARKPDQMTFEQAASLPVAGLTALQSLRDWGKLQPGQRVLINGAAGGVGTFAVQIAKAFGAEVTGVCSTRNVEMLRSLGADRVIDYTREDFTRGGQRYDVLLDNIGNHSIAACRRVVARQGKYLMAGGAKQIVPLLTRALAVLLRSHVMRQNVAFFVAKLCTDDLTALAALVVGGKVNPVIDRRYSLQEVPEAIRYLEAGHARGKVVISLGT